MEFLIPSMQVRASGPNSGEISGGSDFKMIEPVDLFQILIHIRDRSRYDLASLALRLC
jgi:hypothetical protein